RCAAWGVDRADLMQVILQSHAGTVKAAGGGENQTILKEGARTTGYASASMDSKVTHDKRDVCVS
ncbi:hypothetical protein SB766_24090, partial [Pseudomonas sp. SIMBA_077]